jgi:hypothetical protein
MGPGRGSKFFWICDNCDKLNRDKEWVCGSPFRLVNGYERVQGTNTRELCLNICSKRVRLQVEDKHFLTNYGKL